jgi:hypothetical protein
MSTFPAGELLTDLGNGLQGQNTIAYIKTTGGVWVPQSGNSDGSINTTLSGSNMELYGATVNDRPDATTVPVGCAFQSVQTQEIWQSDGTTWVAI